MSGSSSTTTNSSTTPWAPQAAALTSAFSNAGNAYNQSSQAVAPTDYTAQMSPDALAAFKQMVQQGGNLAVPGQQASTGAALQTAGTAGTTGALSGLNNFNAASTNNAGSTVDAANQYVAGSDIPAQVRAAMQGATETARDVTMPGIEQNAAVGGNTNSSRTGIADGMVQRALAEQSANMTGSLSSQEYQNALALAQQQQSNNNTQNLGALSTEGSVGNTATATGVNAGTSSVANQGALSSEMAAGGAGQTAATQADLTNQLQKYQAGVTDPYAPLQGLMGIIGSNNWGSQGTSTATKNPSAWDTISGLMSGGGAALKGISGLMAA